ncbi:glutathione S-transferase N-terminal domain-containing protein [Parvularcula dongshanensis]|uniref:Glutathione S-transferase n=1 Tax=Parvularcula dongshanensis TaxID=1173995 RepID=A0A840I1K8_9PROT|nr:glutathione S-transferase N-terminal domain-containing protein [Parvularcula dongshanensis]MBB4658078.1 glutathione S-transferase [Parvularcula dongshanensis]
MKLYGSKTSPYVRLCRLVAERRGLSGEVEFTPVDPYADEAFRKVNPLGRVPALLLADGTALCDSGVIVRYLDTLGGAPSLFEPEGLTRTEVDAHATLAMGVLELGVANFLEGRRPEDERSAHWLARRRTGIEAGLEEMDRIARGLPESAGLADIAFAVACDWLAFRMPDIGWRQHGALSERVLRSLAAAPFEATDPRKA